MKIRLQQIFAVYHLLSSGKKKKGVCEACEKLGVGMHGEEEWFKCRRVWGSSIEFHFDFIHAKPVAQSKTNRKLRIFLLSFWTCESIYFSMIDW